MIQKLFIGTDFDAGLFSGCLFCEPAGSQFLLHNWRDKDTAFTVFRTRAAMETNTGATGYLAEDRQQALELGRLRDGDFIDECRDKEVEVFEGVADVVFAFDEFTCALVGVMRCPI